MNTRVCAARVLGGFVGTILTVKLSVALPLLLVKAAAIGTAELVGTARRVFYIKTHSLLISTSVGGLAKTTFIIKQKAK